MNQRDKVDGSIRFLVPRLCGQFRHGDVWTLGDPTDQIVPMCLQLRATTERPTSGATLPVASWRATFRTAELAEMANFAAALRRE